MPDWITIPRLVAIGILLLLLWVVRRIARYLRRSKPARLNPKLAKYGGESDFTAKRRREAEKIVATSSMGTIAGYRIVEQIEAVFVDGFRRPEEAMEGLKAAAAMKGANALVNVRRDRQPSGRCSAAGDAVKAIRETEPPIAGGEAEADAPS